jgi:hypothetical protein
MKTCPRCGVEFEANLTVCPLCNFSDIENPGGNNTEFSGPDEEEANKTLYGYIKLSKRQRRKLFWETSVIVLVSGILVTMVIDLITNGQITWSKYSITACLVMFANITLFSFIRHKILLWLFGSFVTTSLLLILLDLFSNKMGWGTQLGIPLLFSLYLIIYLLTLLFRKTRQHGFNMLGYIFLAVGCLSLCIEAIVSRYSDHEVFLGWSLIVMVCMLPIAGILLYIHHRLNKGAELKRFFHI